MLHVLRSTPIMLEGLVRDSVEVRKCVNMSNFSVGAIGASKDALAARANKSCDLGLLHGEAHVIESAPVYAETHGWHLLLLAPSNRLAIVIVTLITQGLVSTGFRKNCVMMCYYMMLQANFITAATEDVFCQFLARQ